MKLFFLNLYFYTLFFVYSAVAIPFLCIIVALQSLFVDRRMTLKKLRRAISWWGRGVTLIPFPFVKVEYDGDIGGNPGEACIFVCNHRSSSDAFLMSILPSEVVQVVNIWPFKIPVLGYFARKAGYLNIRMMNHDSFFDQAVELLRKQVSIIFFPEGTRSASRDMGSFHGSAFRLAMKSQAAVVPLCISGTENIPPKGSLILRPGRIRIRRLPAIKWSEYSNLTVFAFKNRVKEIIGSELALMENKV